MFNVNIPRWVITSINKHFKDRSEDIPLYFERYNRDSDWAELRISGPDFDECTRDSFKLECQINVLITSFIGIDDYKIHRMCGTIAKAYTPICCFRYGDGLEDDQSMFGTLILNPDYNGKVQIQHFGLVTPENKFRRSFVEASYVMTLD